jgi:hypothetical protein
VTALVLADAQAARREAAAILSQARFHNPSVPRPLHSLLHDLGSGLQDLGDAITSAVAAVGSLLPGGTITAWTLLAALIIAAVWLLARRYTRGALAAPSAPGSGPRRRERGPAELEREAEQAEHEGRFADAVRLRFRAGLERLSEEGVIAPAGATPTAEVSRALRSQDFESLARRFDEIAYGCAPAAPDDAQAAREGWSDVLSGGRRR